ncbi:putative DNA base hypermodification protein [Luteolibacter sp. GHJ8]|uniref:DNA base hypermodification protein n=1 Tax=Luteolibacter rhizosphaerae TaxID=2989719 RepID=A0ABT3FZ06_9BACT|nr:nucleotide kinase domain-containing protein [Luteolibacter rhizosphaerae]MCW1912831.1 putative DNA base hypermodification protein [Luteolibacter rhizosphaerae]
MRGEAPPWTKDRILAAYKFTNAYRASDRVSQFLIRNVIYSGDQTLDEVFLRTILFKIFNKVETWELLVKAFGEVSLRTFTPQGYGKVLDSAMNEGKRIYSAAYIMPSGGRNGEFKKKHDMHLHLLKRMMEDSLPRKIQDCEKMVEAFHLLKSYPSIGDFLAYQFVTDLNYSPHLRFSEKEFVCAGPGAIDGISKCFENSSRLPTEEIIKIMVELQHEEFRRLSIDFESLGGRELQLIDCQNLFCEISKYSRVAHPEVLGIAGRTRIKQTFSMTGPPPIPWYPPKWNINQRIKNQL